MYEIKCTIEGIVPMMHHRYNPPDKATAPGASEKKHKGKSDLKNELQRMVYSDKKGLYLPTDNLRMMLIGNRHRIGAAMILGTYIESKKGKQYTEFCKSSIWVVGIEDPQKVYIKPKRTTWDDVDERSFLTKEGGRGITRRPIIKIPWSLTFSIHIISDNFQPGKVYELFEVAGLRCGAGAYGPTFGRFRIVEWEVIENKKGKRKKRA